MWSAGRDGTLGLAVENAGETAGSMTVFGCLSEANGRFGSLRFPKTGRRE